MSQDDFVIKMVYNKLLVYFFYGQHKNNMKRLLNLIIMGMLLTLTVFSRSEQLKGNNSNKEAEILVRVFSKGKPIDNLENGHFRMFVDNKPHPVKKFRIIKKRIKATELNQSPSRCFILIFKLLDYNNAVKKWFSDFFENILTEKDQLRIFVNRKILVLDQIKDKEMIHSRIDTMVKLESLTMKEQSIADIKKIDEFISYLRKDTQRSAGNDQEARQGGKIHQHYYMKYFLSYLERYLNIIHDYNKRYLIPEFNKYVLLLKDIEKLKKEKWILHFYQPAIIPRLSKKNRTTILNMIKSLDSRDWTEVWMDEQDYVKRLNKILGKIDDALNGSTNFQTDKVINLLYDKNITFNSLFLKPVNKPLYKNTKPSSASEKIKNKWKKISQKTGGCFIDLKNTESPFEKLLGNKDTTYLLTYSCETINQKGKINIEVAGRDYQVVYSDNTSKEYKWEQHEKKGIVPRQIQVKDINFKQKRLFLQITNISLWKSPKKKIGQVKLRVQIKNHQNNTIYDKANTLVSGQNSISVSIGLNWLKGGKYMVIIEATDLSLGITRINFSQISL